MIMWLWLSTVHLLKAIFLGENTCVPLGNATFENNLPSEESRGFVQMVQAEYERSSGGTALNLSMKLRRAGMQSDEIQGR